MLNRYWLRTSTGATSLPFGPLRYRAWTSGSGAQAAATSLPFGPIRFRGWTNGEHETPPVVPPMQAFGTRPIRIDFGTTRRIAREDEEITVLLLLLAASGALDGKGQH